MPFAAPQLEITPEQLAERLARGEAGAAPTPPAPAGGEPPPGHPPARRAGGGARLVGGRDPEGGGAGRVGGPRHIELERLASQAETIDRDRPVVFSCRLGARSALAAQAFRSAGWDAWSLQGGLTLWHDQGLPVVPEGGYVAEH